MSIFWGIFILVLYFLPAISAYERKKKNASSIFVINFFLGWTIIGWIVSLSWALTKDEKQTIEVKQDKERSISQELEKLVELKEKGVLTNKEFEVQKSKLLK